MNDASATVTALPEAWQEKKAAPWPGRQARFACVIVLMFAAIILAFGLVFSKILIAEHEAANRERVSVARVFENHKAMILREIERYAASNAAYQHIDTEFDETWVAERFGADMALDFQQDLIVLLDPDGAPRFIKSIAAEPNAVAFDAEFQAGITSLVEQIRENYLKGLVRSAGGDTAFLGEFSGVSGVTELRLPGGQVGLVAAFAIVPDPGGIPMSDGPPHILVTLHLMNQAHLQTLLSSLSLSNLFLNPTIPDGQIGVPIENRSGATLAYLTWESMSQGSRIILSSTPILVIALTIVLTIAMIVLRQNVASSRELEHREQEAQFIAKHDALTGLARRDFFYAKAADLLELSNVQASASAITYLDIDFLKQTNDTYGHVIGDQLIITAADLIRAMLKPKDIAGRLGGDEFIILLTQRPSRAELDAEMEALAAALNRPIRIGAHSLEISCSFGVAVSPDHGADLQALIRAADVALQRCKAGGRRSYKYFDVAMDEEAHQRQAMRNELSSALEKRQFELYYQPILEAGSGRIRFAEALIRWNHPKHGLVPPGVFLPVAADADMMDRIGTWVLDQAVAEASQWAGIGVSVNVCPKTFIQPGFIDEVRTVLDRYRFRPEHLVIEITEELMMDQTETSKQTFDRLFGLGVSVAIDDFGSGFSSLSYLHKYRFEKLKIDRSFVSRIGTDPHADTVVRSMISLAKVLGMEVVAEGVETDQQREFLTASGCEYLQGFLLGRPMPLAVWRRHISAVA